MWVLAGEVELRHVAPAVEDHVVRLVPARRHVIVGRLGDHEEHRADGGLGGAEPLLRRFHVLLQLGGAGDGGGFLVALELADLLAGGILLGLELLEGLLGADAGVVGVDERRDVDGDALGLGALAVLLGILAEVFEVNHGVGVLPERGA